MLTDDQLKEIRTRCEAATPGEWRWHFRHDAGAYRITRKDEILGFVHSQWNAVFLANAHEDMPALLTHIEEQSTEIDRLRVAERRYHCLLLQQLPGMSRQGTGPETVYFSDGLKGSVETLERLEEAGLFVRVGDGKPGHIYGRLTARGLEMMGGKNEQG